MAVFSENGTAKFLNVAKMDRWTGEAQASACITYIGKWDIKCHVKGFVFDTTDSNTGLVKLFVFVLRSM